MKTKIWMQIGRWFSLSGILLLFFQGQARAIIQPGGAVQQVEVKADPVFGNSYLLLTLDQGEVEITPFAPDVIRVRYHWTPLWEKENIAIAKPFGEWPGFDSNFYDAGGAYIIETPQLVVEIVKSPVLQIHFKDKEEGFYLSKDSRMEVDPDYNPLWDSTFQGLRWTKAWPQGFKLKEIRESPSNEAYFGFGEVSAPLNRRGLSIQGWNADTFDWHEWQNPMYMTLPFFYGVQGDDGDHPAFSYAIFFNNPARPFFRMASEWPDLYSFQAADGQIDYFFFGGGADHNMKACLDRYTELTGRPTMLPKWAFGYHISRWTYNNQGWMEWLGDEHRARDFPLDAIYLDIDYMDIYADESYDDGSLRQLTINGNYPDPAGMIKKLQSQGIKIVPIVEPWISAADPNWNEAASAFHFIKNNDGSSHVSKIFFGPVSWIDWSSTPARNWWKQKVLKFFDSYPFAGIWNDLNEPADNDMIPLNGLFWLDGKYGKDPNDARRWFLNEKNQLALRETSLSYEILATKYPNQRPFVLSRSGFPGIQRYALGWSGDNDSSFDALRYNISVGVSTMISGQANFGHDVGGFVGDSSGELLTRWSEWASMNPLFRNHSMKSNREREPWRFGDAYGDKIREIIKFRYRMLPYLYSLAYQSTQTGTPMNTPTVFHFFGDTESHYRNDNDFMIGDYLLAAPVYEAGKNERWVYLPDKNTNWYYWSDNKRYKGGSWAGVNAPLGTLPLFARAGAIIPMGPAMKYVDEYRPNSLDVHVFPSGTSEFELYEDDGQTFDYLKNVYAKTRFISSKITGSFKFTIQSRLGTYDPGKRDFVVIVHDRSCPPIQVTLDGSPMQQDPVLASASTYRYDPGSAIFTAKIADTGQESVLRLDVDPSCDAKADSVQSANEPSQGSGCSTGGEGGSSDGFFLALALALALLFARRHIQSKSFI